jgi:hypothetical protein
MRPNLTALLRAFVYGVLENYSFRFGQRLIAAKD